MKLEIVWRNPASRPVATRRIEQIVADDFGAIYAVHTADAMTVFELILRSAA
jgi:hypothetical protein